MDNLRARVTPMLQRSFARSPRGALLALVAVLLLCSVSPAARIPRVAALDNGVARTPPMGWNSWYGLGCDMKQQDVREIADALVTSGLRDAGYTYVNLDDCWAEGRRSDGTIVPDAVRFPDGIPALANYVHARGFKFGLYTDAGATTCAGRPGSLDHEQQDAMTYAFWGVDFVKEDWCDTEGLDPSVQYGKFRDALAAASATYRHPIVFSICDPALDQPWAWGPSTGNLWRTSEDIVLGRNGWQRMLEVLDENAAHASAAGPGAWNDPDNLQTGLGAKRGSSGMTELEERAQFSMWTIMAAPLIIGADPRTMSDFTRQTLTNADAIAIDQDPAGVQGTLVKQDSTDLLQVWSKPLQAPGSRAVALFNRGDEPTNLTVAWRDIRLPLGWARVKDVWAGTEPTYFFDRYSAGVPAHAVALLVITASS